MKRIETSFTGVAYSILKKHGKPMHSRKLLKEILKQKSSTGKTPHATLTCAMIRDKRFKRIRMCVYGLSEWK